MPRVGRWIGEKLNACPGRSALPDPGKRRLGASTSKAGHSWDPEADAALFEAIEATVAQTTSDDPAAAAYQRPGFAKAAAASLQDEIASPLPCERREEALTLSRCLAIPRKGT
jgi:uncharacterized protein (UPF0261 family)